MVERVDLDVPRWDQTQYWGRVKYFFTTTNPLNIFKSDSELQKCKHIVDNYKYVNAKKKKLRHWSRKNKIKNKLFSLLKLKNRACEGTKIYIIHRTICRKDGIVPNGLTLGDVYKSKDVVDSAFHPETGEKMIIFGRMSAQVPMNMLITGCMVTFYK